jgi:hypothetical protein
LHSKDYREGEGLYYVMKCALLTTYHFAPRSVGRAKYLCTIVWLTEFACSQYIKPPTTKFHIVCRANGFGSQLYRQKSFQSGNSNILCRDFIINTPIFVNFIFFIKLSHFIFRSPIQFSTQSSIRQVKMLANSEDIYNFSLL